MRTGYRLVKRPIDSGAEHRLAGGYQPLFDSSPPYFDYLGGPGGDAGARAYATAGIGPQDVDVAVLHDYLSRW